LILAVSAPGVCLAVCPGLNWHSNTYNIVNSSHFVDCRLLHAFRVVRRPERSNATPYLHTFHFPLPNSQLSTRTSSSPSLFLDTAPSSRPAAYPACFLKNPPITHEDQVDRHSTCRRRARRRRSPHAPSDCLPLATSIIHKSN
jgi:hypothetical protein